MTAGKAHLVLTAVGPDRPGLVQRISALIHEAGANIEDSRMAILGGEFALILLLGGPSGAAEAVKARAGEVERELGLRLSFKETALPTAGGDYLPYRIRVSGLDRAGIVARVTKILAGRGINVASLESRLTYAPLSGTPMFLLKADLQIPSATALAQLRRELGAACDEDNLDFVLEGG